MAGNRYIFVKRFDSVDGFGELTRIDEEQAKASTLIANTSPIDEKAILEFNKLIMNYLIELWNNHANTGLKWGLQSQFGRFGKTVVFLYQMSESMTNGEIPS